MTEPDQGKHKSLFEHFRDFIKKNHEDNRQNISGWHERLQNIYVTHYSAAKLTSGKTRHWMKYPNKK